jgi:hypothetical protein
MDHAEARELLELAALEPHGFERLTAGDTNDAAALAGHLAGCEECADEMARLREASAIIREVVRTTPPSELRDRTLAFVRNVGRERGEAAAPAAPATLSALPARPAAVSEPASLRRSFPAPVWAAAIAAALVVAVIGTGFVVRSQVDEQLKRQATVVDQLARVTSWYIDIEGQDDSRRVALASPSVTGASGTVEFSPGTGRLVIVANGLTEPAAGQQVGCWIEVDGNRRAIGRMSFGGGISYWAGPVGQLAALPPGARFGISAPGGDTLLIGEL